MTRPPVAPSVEEALAAAERAQSALNAFITITAKEALAEARAAQVEKDGGASRGPLHGVPVALKDLIATQGTRTTAGSAILKDWVPRRDAAVVWALRESGAISIGKTNTHEFAFGTTNDNPHYGPTRNPWDPGLSTGGSSGGSAAAVAAGIVPIALGTDTAGSIRIPAALCGAVGLKPTYGVLPTRGIVPLAPTLDTVGPIGRMAEDVALALAALTGEEAAEGRGSGGVAGTPGAPTTEPGLDGLRIGVPEHYVFDRVNAEIEASVREALRLLESLGAEVRAVEIPEVEGCVGTGTTIVRSEALAFHRRWFPARAAEYGDDVARSLEAAAEISAEEYLAARATRRRVGRAMRRALAEVDLLAGPTVPILAFPNREAYEPVLPGGELPRFALTRLTYPFSLSRLPAISVPCGLSRSGLPIGLQLGAGPRRESLLLAVTKAYERARGPWPAPAPR